MNTTGKSTLPRLGFHPQAYDFVLAALRYTQEERERRRPPRRKKQEEAAHITGQELAQGIRRFASAHFGLLALTVFRQWGIRTTEDFGRIVFEMIERGDMRKTERDHLSDFFDLYDFEEVFDRQYPLDLSQAFGN